MPQIMDVEVVYTYVYGFVRMHFSPVYQLPPALASVFPAPLSGVMFFYTFLKGMTVGVPVLFRRIDC